LSNIPKIIILWDKCWKRQNKRHDCTLSGQRQINLELIFLH
jgi:hypothetical protein